MIFERLFRGGERELVESLRNHVALSREAVGYSLRMLLEPLKLTQAELFEYRAKTVDLEKRGDRIYDRMISSVLKGAFPLPLIADLGTLLDDFDDILDLIYFLNMELVRGIGAGLASNEVVLEIYAISRRMLERTFEALTLLDGVLSHILRDVSRAAEESSKIDFLEDLVDEMKNEAIERVYAESSKLSILGFTHLLEVIRTVDTVLDKIQDVSQGLIRIFSAVLS